VFWHWNSFPVIYLAGAFMNLVILAGKWYSGEVLRLHPQSKG
jgi:hypothetical protein